MVRFGFSKAQQRQVEAHLRSSMHPVRPVLNPWKHLGPAAPSRRAKPLKSHVASGRCTQRSFLLRSSFGAHMLLAAGEAGAEG